MSPPPPETPSPAGAGPPGRLRYAGRVALVTGATSGVGLATARRLHREGACLVLTGRSAGRGVQLAGELAPAAVFSAADLDDEAAADRVAGTALDAFGRLDLLVNNAGRDHTGDLLAAAPGEVRAVFETNTFAVLRMLQAAAGRMGTGGAIVNITSRLAVVGVPGMGVYSASKGAVLALTRAAAVELAPRGIRVNAVAPGMTDTALYRAWLAAQPDPSATAAGVRSRIPLGRVADPDDVAAAVAYLGSDDAAHVTGASLPVDGGYTAH